MEVFKPFLVKIGRRTWSWCAFRARYRFYSSTESGGAGVTWDVWRFPWANGVDLAWW